MNARKLLPTFLHAQPPLAGALAVLVALLAAYIDWITRVELNVSVLYGLPLVLGVATRNRRLLWGTTTFLLITTFVVYSLQIPPGRFSPLEPFFIDRLLSAAAVLVIACLLHYRMAALDTMEAQRRMLSLQNEELDRRRREAEEANRRKTRLLASASHDVRTPVYAITLMTEAILQAAKNPSLATRIPELAERLQANATSLDRLISDLLDVARFDSGPVLVQESTFSLDDLLVEQCANLHPLAHAKNLRLDVEAADQPIWLCTDRVKLAQVVSNLLGNAIKFTEIGGIAVNASVTSDQVLIRVRDTGVGIGAEHLDGIFDEFAQLQNGKGGHGEGWGLGLPICRRLIKALGGTITVESEPGRGSTFITSLPSRCIVDAPDARSASTPLRMPGT
ncbi:MAG: HAMP domain-containing histidine kinase [Betaproteobacteria bacterium]|nr:HAMP domain-containing histidine kinase [Betaproteobacteria bacterium]